MLWPRSQDGDGQLGLDELRQALSAVVRRHNFWHLGCILPIVPANHRCGQGDLDGLGTAEQAWTGAEVDALFAALDTEGLGRYEYGPRAPESF